MKTNFRVSSFLVLCMIVLWTTTPALARPDSNDLQTKVDAYIQETMRRFPIPGMAVGIVKDDKVLYLQGYGTANIYGDAVTPQTPFPLQSVTKTFTALAAHQLAATGKLDLNAPLQTYIPEFRLADQNASRSITVRHLLDHTSGISKTEGEQSYLQSPKSTFEQALRKLAGFHPNYQPGIHYEYSNWNYALLGEVIGRVSGLSYIDYVQQNILNPLQMTHTGFADDEALPRAATGNLIVFGIPVPYEEKYIPAMLGAANLCASAEEMTHYLMAYFNKGQYLEHNVLSAQGQGWYDDSWNWHAGHPSTSLSNSFSGAHNATQANITIFPSAKVGVVVLMNTRLEQFVPGPGAWNFAYDIAHITMDDPYEVPSNRGFYAGYALLDGILLALIASILWQAFELKDWSKQDQTGIRFKRFAARSAILFDLLLCIGILVLPAMVHSRWNVLIYHRPDFAIPLLVIGISLGLLGLTKIVLAARRP